MWTAGERDAEFLTAGEGLSEGAGAGIDSARIPHDARRTVVQTLDRAGVPRSVAMAMVGHKTEAIYQRYGIVSAAMFRGGRAQARSLSPTTLHKMALPLYLPIA